MVQKEFFPRVNGRSEHIIGANIKINKIMTTKKTLKMLAIDMENTFRSVTHRK
jgi:hypothetical protein